MRLVCLAAAGVLAMLAASRAHAGWREVTAVTERPNGVLDVWGKGTFSLGYLADGGGGAYLFVDGGVARKPRGSEASESVGTSYQPDTDCFVSVSSYGQRTSIGADGGLCGGVNPSTPINYTDDGIKRVKHTAGGGAAMVTDGQKQHTLYLSDAGLTTPADTFSAVLSLDQDSRWGAPFAVARVGDSVYSVIGVSGSVPAGMWEAIPSRTRGEWKLGTPEAGLVQAVELFPVQGKPVPFAMVGARHAFIRGSLDNTTPPIEVVQELGAGEELVALSMNVREGGDGGHGFGMALVKQADGGLQVMSPVPMESEERAGTIWLPRVIPPNVLTAKLEQVACHGASFCVLTAPGETVHNVFTYSNEAGPELAVLGSDGGVVTEMDFEENTNLQLTFLGKDSDGDPVRLATSSSVTGPWEVKSVSGAPGEPVVMEISTKSICQTTDVGHLEVTASDGLAAHAVRRTMPVRVLHTSPPEMPQVVRSDGGVVGSGQLAGELVAGGEFLTLDAVGDMTSAKCRWKSKSWSRVSADGPLPMPDTDNSARLKLKPPAFFCEAGGRDYQYQLDVMDEGDLSNFQRYTVHQKPWGAPEPVFIPDGVVQRVRSGERVELSPEKPHGCANTPGFPGMVSRWEVNLDGGGVPGPELSIQKREGGAVTSFPVDATGLVIQTTACQPPAQVRVLATSAVGADRGKPSHRDLLIESAWTPLRNDSLQVSLSESAQTLRVDSPLDCEVERKLSANLRLEPEDANVPTRTTNVAVPGEWSLTDLDCGLYHLRATLQDSTGSSVEQQERSMVLPGPGVSLEAHPQNGMKAVCGQGATLSLASLVTPTPGFCQTPDYTWTYESAVELEQLSEPDGTIRLVTKEKELDALLGGSVRVGVTASKGPARTELSFDVPISVDPFVTVGRRSELPVASETGLVSVLVDLTNTTACDVSGARYVEHLEGLAYVEGSATLDGAPVETHWNGHALQVDGLLLAGGATRTLGYVARPLLVGERRMWGEASKGDVRLSVSEGNEPRPSGCGCASAESGPLLFVLATMGAALRRRRR